MVLPTSGPLPVHGHLPGSLGGIKSKRAIVMKLPDEIVQALMARRGSSPNDPPLDIDFGDRPVCLSHLIQPPLPHLTLAPGHPHRRALFPNRICPRTEESRNLHFSVKQGSSTSPALCFRGG